MTINDVICVIDGHRKVQIENLRNTRFLMWTMVRMWGKDAPSRPEELMQLPGDEVEDLSSQNEELLAIIKEKTLGAGA